MTVDYATGDRTAARRRRLRARSGTLSFAPGQTAKTIVVPIVDAGPKPSRSFALSLSN